MNDEFIFSETIVEWNTKHCGILVQFLDSLDKVGVKYIILKNHEGLPEQNFSKDIDILIEPGKYKIASSLLYKTYKENGVSHYKVHKFERLRCWYGMNPDTKFAIHIDLLEGFLHKGFELFPFELLYKNSYKNEHGINILSSVDDCLILLLHSTICYHFIKPKYAKKIALEFERSPKEMQALLHKILGKNATCTMVGLLEKGDYNKIAELGKHFSHISKMRIFIRHPLFSIYNMFDFLWEKIQRVLICRDKFTTLISVHAPDGTGKTTFIQKISEELGFYFVCNPKDIIDIRHFRPLMLPNLGAVGEKVRVMKQDTNFTVPHRAKSVGGLSSFFRMVYYWLDYVIGMPIILRRNAQFDRITIFDRYIYDFIVDPARARISLPLWMRYIFARWVKQPRLIFILKTDANTIYQRKQELELLEIKRQLVKFDELSVRMRKSHIMDASKSPGVMAHDAIKIMVNEFANEIK